MEHITSRKNPLISHIRKLAADRAYRRESGEFLGDGTKLLEEAVRWNAHFTAVVCSPGIPFPPIQGVRKIEVPGDVMASISPAKSPQGTLFVAKLPDTAPPERLTGRRWLVLDGLQDPGNVGTIWRTADAFGADGLILVNRCADPFSPKTVRATMGACFRLPVYEMVVEDLPGLLERSGLSLYAAAVWKNTVDIETVQLDRCAVVIGSEGKGVSPELLSLSQKAVQIPMRARCESLNAAAAATVILWEMSKNYSGGKGIEFWQN